MQLEVYLNVQHINRPLQGGKGIAEIECNDDIPETATTLEGNALIKARYIKEHYGYDCFADDTGLLVDALDGAPGVYSARYAGEDCNPQKNMEKLLTELDGIEQRGAAFVTCVALFHLIQ